MEMPSNDTHDAFLAKCVARPDDDAPRLAYADWLDAQKDPQGEFIRLQCKTVKMPHDDPKRAELLAREVELLDEHGKNWAGRLPKMPDVWWLDFHRGLVQTARIWGWEIFREVADQVYAATPIRQLRFWNVTAESAMDLAESAKLSPLYALLMGNNLLFDDGAAAMAQSPHLDRIVLWDVWDCHIGDAGAAGIAAAPGFLGLKALDLRLNKVGPAGAEALADSLLTARLHSLDLTYNRLGDAGAAFLAASPHVAGLHNLGLRDDGVTDAGAAAVADSASLLNLHHLDLSKNRIGDDGVKRLAQSPVLGSLRTLGLQQNPLGDAAAAALA
ncbi:MAG: TIGR02996 domain-containing protein, partial [Planctomycetia bacterium]